jgi:hypothetical protein
VWLSAQDAIEWPRQSWRVPSDLAGRDGTGRGLRVLCRCRLAHQPVNWYLRSLADADTHRGELRADGSVHALCGVEFVPRPLPLGGPALPGSPLDPDQICPACRGTKATR